MSDWVRSLKPGDTVAFYSSEHPTPVPMTVREAAPYGVVTLNGGLTFGQGGQKVGRSRFLNSRIEPWTDETAALHRHHQLAGKLARQLAKQAHWSALPLEALEAVWAIVTAHQGEQVTP